MVHITNVLYTTETRNMEKYNLNALSNIGNNINEQTSINENSNENEPTQERKAN